MQRRNLASFAGSADMRTVNGGVAISEAAGDIRGRTQNGGGTATLTGRTWEGRGLDLETTNGGVTISVPAEYSAELETGTVNGGLRVDLPITIQGRVSQRIRTRLGAGGPLIRAMTANGGVTVRTR